MFPLLGNPARLVPSLEKKAPDRAFVVLGGNPGPSSPSRRRLFLAPIRFGRVTEVSPALKPNVEACPRAAQSIQPDRVRPERTSGGCFGDAGVGHESAARLLLAGTPRQVLARIVPRDPLGLRGRCAERLRSRSQFADVDRVLVRSQARIARAAIGWLVRTGLTNWLNARIDEAIDDVLDEDSQHTTDKGSVFQLLSAPLGLSALEMAQGCARFNALPEAVRTAFFVLVVEGLALEHAAKRLGRTALEVAHLAREGLDVFQVEADGSTTPLNAHNDPQLDLHQHGDPT